MDNQVTFDVIISNKNVIVTSNNVADIFHKRHTHVLRRIDELKRDWNKLDLEKEFSPKVGPIKRPKFKDCFFESDYITENSRTVRSISMNRTGFVVLTSSFHGKNSLEFKLAYIARFDAMEAELTKRNTLYELEKQLRKQLTDAIKATYVGDRLDREIMKLTNLLYIVAAGHKASKLKRDRGLDSTDSAFADGLTSDERSTYMVKENQLILQYQLGLTDYQLLKAKLLGTSAA